MNMERSTSEVNHWLGMIVMEWLRKCQNGGIQSPSEVGHWMGMIVMGIIKKMLKLWDSVPL